MFAKTGKTGLSLLAAAGVAFGVVGMTMGGASGSTVSCRPSSAVAGSGSDGAQRSSSSRHGSDSADSRGSHDSSATDGAGATDPEGNNDNGDNDNDGNATDPGTTIGAGVTIPNPDTPPSTGSDSDSQRSRPLLDVREHTNPTNAAGVEVPHTGTSVIGRSSNVSGLHIVGRVIQGR